MNTITQVKVPNLLVDGYVWSDMLSNLSREKFPHTDMIKNTEGEYEIQLSLAGYDKDVIDISLDSNILSVEGEWTHKHEGTEYLMHGIAKRSFKRIFPLAEYIEVDGVSMDNGILSIKLKKNIPEELKPKTFKIK